MAEARSAVAEPRVSDLQEGRSAWRDLASACKRSLTRSFYRTRNMIRNGMWPASIYNLGVGVAAFSTCMVVDWKPVEPLSRRLWGVSRILHLPTGLPYSMQVLAVSVSSGVAFFILLLYTRRWLLRLLLKYRGWMYETPRNQSCCTTVWGCVVWLLSGYQPTTYSYQKSLPRLPVPPLSQTIDRFLSSMKPLYGSESEEFKKLCKNAQEFKHGLGPKLQHLLVLKSYWSRNWVTDWWGKYIYLMNRDPVAINSNYYILDHAGWTPTIRQTSRAAQAIYQFLICKQMIEHETLPPLLVRNTVPMCMAQYEKIFSTTRLPGVDCDKLVKYHNSKHIVVMRRGLYYRLDVYDTKCQHLLPQSLEQQLDWIVEDADKHYALFSEHARSIAALTALSRPSWAKTRNEFFMTGLNKESLDVLESAIFHVVLDTESYKSWTEEGKHLLHGDGATLWFDKSFNIVFFANGRLGLNTEHSWGDAPVMGHVSEYVLTNEVLHESFDDSGHVIPVNKCQASLVTPHRLQWNIPVDLEHTIDHALEFTHKNADDLDLVVAKHSAYGKGFMKKCKVSPDAFVQMALQLTYFKDSNGLLAMTYESSMTRLYRLGRTETVRSLTDDSAKFIRAMMDTKCNTAERVTLLRRACDKHQLMYRDAMNGRGVDRHLFGLFVACKGLGYESEFLKDALMVPWILSTSQQPQQQIATSPDCNDPKFMDKEGPGGGFGPVADRGYGVSYMFPSDAMVYFHVSSKRTSAATDSSRFVGLLFDSLRDMRQLFGE